MANPYAVTSWEFLQWNDQVIAVALEAPVQAITIGGTRFADLITSTRKPQARRINSIRDFVVLGDVTDTVDGTMPARVWWSANDNATDFTPALATQSGIQDLETGDGKVTKVIGGEFGLIFQERAVTRMTFEGGNTTFRFDKVIRNRGALSAGSVIGFNRVTYFIDEDGFYVTDGTDAIPIGKDKIDRFFSRDVNLSNADRISATVEPQNSLVCWSYMSNDASGTPDRIVTYNWATQTWGLSEFDVQLIFNHRSTTETVDGGSISGDTVDSHAETVDSALFKGGLELIAAFDPLNQLNTFSGAALDARVVTGEFQPFDGLRTYLNSARPIIAGPTAAITVQVGARELQTDAPVFSSAVAVNAIGEANLRESARYMRLQINISGGFDEAQGVSFDPKQAGRR